MCAVYAISPFPTPSLSTPCGYHSRASTAVCFITVAACIAASTGVLDWFSMRQSATWEPGTKVNELFGQDERERLKCWTLAMTRPST